MLRNNRNGEFLDPALYVKDKGFPKNCWVPLHFDYVVGTSAHIPTTRRVVQTRSFPPGWKKRKFMMTVQVEDEILTSLRSRRGHSAVKWTMFVLLLVVTYSAFFFGLVLTIARIDGEFVGEV
jgi:hypothetical protein